ncbi:MAG: class II aldolase/adducin family protein [Candidatus Bathyarchaeota archaeon]
MKITALNGNMQEGKIKFNTVFVSDKVPTDSKLEELKHWCKVFQKNGLTPEVEGNYTGNLSFRAGQGFVITASALKDKENLVDDCFVFVKEYDPKTNTFYVEGEKKPSSESIMHQMIYDANKQAQAVFHGHIDVIVQNAEKLGLPLTGKEFASGTIGLANEVLKILGDNKMIVLKNHGFVSLGKIMNEAGDLALATLRDSEQLNITK